MQAIKCSTCRQLVFIYDGDIRVGTIKAAKATYPDGTKAAPGRFLVRPCGHGKIYGRQDNSLYIDGEMETPRVRNLCEGCGNEIDPDCCGCGGPIEGHTMYSGHSPIPMGCDCGRVNPSASCESGDRDLTTSDAGSG